MMLFAAQGDFTEAGELTLFINESETPAKIAMSIRLVIDLQMFAGESPMETELLVLAVLVCSVAALVIGGWIALKRMLRW